MVERILVTRHSHDQTSAQTIVLPDPRSGKPQAYIVKAGGSLEELQRSKHFFSSWLVGQSIIQDGGLYLATPVDPVFVLLPFLERSRKRVSI